jgi:hypothetical protein
MLVDATAFLIYSLDKQEHYRQVIVKAMVSKDDLSREVMHEESQDFPIILVGSHPEIDLILNGKPSPLNPRLHVFDFPSKHGSKGLCWIFSDSCQ